MLVLTCVGVAPGRERFLPADTPTGCHVSTFGFVGGGCRGAIDVDGFACAGKEVTFGADPVDGVATDCFGGVVLVVATTEELVSICGIDAVAVLASPASALTLGVGDRFGTDDVMERSGIEELTDAVSAVSFFFFFLFRGGRFFFSGSGGG